MTDTDPLTLTILFRSLTATAETSGRSPFPPAQDPRDPTVAPQASGVKPEHGDQTEIQASSASSARSQGAPAPSSSPQVKEIL